MPYRFQEPETASATFRFSIFLQVFLWFGTIMFFGCVFGWLWATSVEVVPIRTVFVLLSIFTGFAFFSFWGALRLGARIDLDAEGVTRTSITGRVAHIPWNELAEVDEGAISQTLILRDRMRTVKIVIENQINGYDDLRKIIAARAAVTQGMSETRLPMVFTRSLSLRVFLVLVYLMMGISFGWLIPFGQPFAMIATGLLAGLLFWMSMWHTLHVDFDGLTFRYLGRRKWVPIEQIIDVTFGSLKAHDGASRHVIPQVRIRRHGAKDVVFSAVRGGTLAVHAAVRAALQGRE